MSGETYEWYVRRIVRRVIVRERDRSPFERHVVESYGTTRRRSADESRSIDERAVDRVVQDLVARHPHPRGATRHGGDRELVTRRLE